MTEISTRPNYMVPKRGPTEETKKIWKMGSEINQIKKQTEFIKEYNLTPSEFSKLNQKKLDIL